MFSRDNRLNSIHRFTAGIQSLDLLRQRVPMINFKGYQTFLNEMFLTTLSVTSTQSLQDYAVEFRNALDNLKEVTIIVMGASKTQNLDLVFFIFVSHLNMPCHITITWLWLRQVEIATKSLKSEPYGDDVNFYNEKIQAIKYFFNSELPLTNHWCNLVKNIDSVSFDSHPDWL
jgi:hypothetical protein